MASATPVVTLVTGLLAAISMGDGWLPCTHLCPLLPPFLHSLMMLGRSHLQAPELWPLVRTSNPGDEQSYLQTVYSAHTHSQDHFGWWP